ncbi:hypothetical protein GIY23_09080 [Allosaccharopolyspora coralli]|uniref:Secreted protein n=1 Tax=Allosaccharopolyspora coralli TaxID=2665642 RepID=A0A5Q3QDS2_9PSEU|nr:hypothetical protein [Allosaccharopolyspora coralli]QGK69649.1 hypothetical protein GIY23_09080 [Allosaccharopolyspora coralli]
MRVAASILLVAVFAVVSPWTVSASVDSGMSGARPWVHETRTEPEHREQDKLRESVSVNRTARGENPSKLPLPGGISGSHPVDLSFEDEDARIPSVLCSSRHLRPPAESRHARHAPAALQVFRR